MQAGANETSADPIGGADRVAVVGGGVAGLEALLALADLAAGRTDLHLVADRPQFEYLPSRLMAAMHEGAEPERRDLGPIAEKVGAKLVAGRVEAVDPEDRRLLLSGGESLDYDHAILCIGAKFRSQFRRAPALAGGSGSPTVQGLIEAAARHPSRRIALIVPPGTGWTLPIYELALLCARMIADRDVSIEPVIVTPEAGPLIMFGPTVSDRVYELLRSRGVSVLPSTYAHEEEDGSIVLTPGGHILDAGSAVSLPVHEGPGIDGVPADAGGFLPIDDHARVRGCEGLFAAGDATNFPIKQGGIAAQQADAAAEQIAYELGCVEEPKPFHPVLRGKFLLGEPTLYMQADVAGGAGEADLSQDRLWWPSLKVGARYLGPLLAGHSLDEVEALDRPPLDLEVNLSGEWYRDPLALDPYGPLRHD